MAERLVVVGGDAAGMSAASQVRRMRGDVDVVALEMGTRTSYAACGIPYHVAGLVPEVNDLVARTPDEFRNRQHIDVRLRSQATAIDTAAGVVEVRDLERDRTYTLGYDHLLIGTGARPVRPPIPGIEADWVAGVKTLDDSVALAARAASGEVRRVVVVGGGYIGIEMAEAFVERGCAVTVVDAAPQVLGTLDADMAERVRAGMEAAGITVRLGVAVQGFDDHRVVLADGELPADLAVLGLGVTPNSGLAADAGIELGPRGAIRVDRRQRTSAAGVWSAGDCATARHLITGDDVFFPLGTVANRQGRVAGINIGGSYATFAGVLGTAITKVCDTEAARTGLGEAEAAAAGFEVVTAVAESRTRANYYPGAERIAVKVIAYRRSGRLLGGQIVGGQGAAKRIDTLVTAITAGFDLDRMVDLDLAYAPPFSPVWDPVVTACRQALRTFSQSRP
jgi:NADPH-dependent 2,4-dienoyl-CoA reductase/sulfur reductase-like enzyme